MTTTTLTRPQVAPAVTSGVRLGRRLLIAAAIAILLAALDYVLLVHTVLGQRFDNAALFGAREQGTATRLGDVNMLHRITADSFAVVLVILVAFGWLRRRPRLGVSVAVAAALAVIGTDLLRIVILNRPLLVRSDGISVTNTFPSGHTATAITCALALVVIAPPAWRGVCAVLAGSYAWVTAAAVQTAGWHRPSDAIGAAFLGFAAVAVLTAVVAMKRPIGTGRRFGHVPAFVVLGGVWLVTGAVAALNAARVLHYLVDHNDTLAPTPTVLNEAYQFSVNLTILVVVSVLAATLILLGRSDLDEPQTPR
jgi:membrane-associated phospholipid phosphatase